MNGTELLAVFRKSGSDEAFGELVRRYTNLVYSSARRQTNNASLAEEVSQLVFLRLAKAAPDLSGEGQLVAWLHRTTVHVSIDLWRSENRRRVREERSVSMQTTTHEESSWNEISEIIDEELDKLSPADRQTILLRYFDHQAMREVGLALGISEDAAKMRVSRALDKLRDRLGARGLTCTAAALGTMAWECSVEAAPVALTTSLVALKASSVSGVGTSGLTGVMQHISLLKMVVVVVLTVLVGGTFWVKAKSQTSRNQSSEAKVNDVLTVADTNKDTISANGAITSAETPDPTNLLKKVFAARQRIRSGSLEIQRDWWSVFQNQGYTKTNRMVSKISFEGDKRRFDTRQREYAYIENDTQTQTMIDARLRELNGDHEAAVNEGLLEGENAHIVTIGDGELLLEFRNDNEDKGSSGRVKIDDLKKGTGNFLYDPRCLGISLDVFKHSLENHIKGFDRAKSIRLVGGESVNSIPAWHIQVTFEDWTEDFWLETARTEHVLQYVEDLPGAFETRTIRSKYSSPNDVLPCEVIETTVSKGVKRSHSVTQISHVVYNVAFESDTWTLAGLNMPIGTEITDYRLHLTIGYWNGTGISERKERGKTSATNQEPQKLSEKVAIMESLPVSEEALQAAIWIMLNAPDGQIVDEAAGVILTNHLYSSELAELSAGLERVRPRASTNLLQAILKNTPDKATKANACYTLAMMFTSKGDYGRDPVATESAIKYLELVKADYLNYVLPEHVNRIRDELHRLRFTSVGKAAPEIEGEDMNGKPMKLSDFRGRTTVLIFWMCSKQDLKDYAQLHFSDQVAVVGVFSQKKQDEALGLLEEMHITWPSFYDRDGRIRNAWCYGFPQVQVIDANGIIRYRDLRWSSEVMQAVKELGAQ